jgi:hypothetical protein
VFAQFGPRKRRLFHALRLHKPNGCVKA